MITVVVMLSGVHRLDMLRTALGSIPFASPHVTAVNIMHQGGAWDWGGELRRQMEAHPKVRVIEFPHKVDFAESYNRTLAEVKTPWGLLLPDDDHLLPASAASAFETVATSARRDDPGFIAFGWYYLKNDRYIAAHVKARGLKATLHHCPKFCTTLLNLRRVRELGGFDARVGGFDDSVLFGKLAYEYDALIATPPIGVYRLHAGQESAKLQAVYGPYVTPLLAALGPYARSPRERAAFEQCIADYLKGEVSPGLAMLQTLKFHLQSVAQPLDMARAFSLRRWSTIRHDSGLALPNLSA